ncbi:hypothetical protein ACVMB0_002181 [Bradyrhizobium sp. USDA 4451]
MSFMTALRSQWEFSRQQFAQHVGDGDAALECGDLDAAAQRRRDVDCQARGSMLLCYLCDAATHRWP